MTAGSQALDGSLRNDGNTVDLESEMTALVETRAPATGPCRDWSPGSSECCAPP